MATTTLDLEVFFLKRAIDNATFKGIDEKESEKTKQLLYNIVTKWKMNLSRLKNDKSNCYRCGDPTYCDDCK